MNHIPHRLTASGNGSWHFKNNVMNLLQMRLGSGTIISKPVSHGRLHQAGGTAWGKGSTRKMWCPPARDLHEQPQKVWEVAAVEPAPLPLKKVSCN